MLFVVTWLCRRAPASDENLTTIDQGRLTTALRGIRERCWSQLPLRYWRCVFFLFLLLLAFWTASVVRDDSHEGLQSLQGGGGGSLSPMRAWRGGSLPPLLLNSDSPQHVKVAATAVARGREASDQLIWLLHTATRQQYGKLILWLRTVYRWLDSTLLQPLLSLLRHAGILASFNGTCYISDAPYAAENNGGWWWILQVRSAIQSAVRSLPSAAQDFLCGERRRSSASSGEHFPEWLAKASETRAGFGVDGNAMETGSYCLALVLLLIYALSTALQNICLAIPSALRRVLAAWGIGMSSAIPGDWADALAVTGTSAATSFAVTFPVLLLLYAATAAASKALGELGSLGCALFRKTCTANRSSEIINSGDPSPAATSSASNARKARGVVALEILAASLTCWLLLLSDRNFVMFTWASMQPLRISLLSAVLLLRLPSAQVATLLSWPPPLREPALLLQRSQPLKIIDPVAIGSMLGCIFAAVALSIIWHAVTRVNRFLKGMAFQAIAARLESSLRPLGCTRGRWTYHSRPTGSSSPDRLSQQLQKQSQKILELQKLLTNERRKATLSDQLVVQLQTELRLHAAAADREGLTTRRLQQQQEELQNQFKLISSAADEALSGKGQLQEELGREPEAWQREAQNKLEQQPRLIKQQEAYYGKPVADLQRQLDDVQRPLSDTQSKLLEQKQHRENEAKGHLQRETQLERELDDCQRLLKAHNAATMWKEKQMMTSVEHDQLQMNPTLAMASLEDVTTSRNELEKPLEEATKRCSLWDEKIEIIVRKHFNDICAKTTEINDLRKNLTEALHRCEQQAARLRDYQCRHARQDALAQEEIGSSREEQENDVGGVICSPQDEVVQESPNSLGLQYAATREEGTQPGGDVQLSSLVSQGASAATGLSDSLLQRQRVDDLMKILDSERSRHRKRIRQMEEKLNQARLEASRLVKLCQQLTQQMTCSVCSKKLYQEQTEEGTSRILSVVEDGTREITDLLDGDEQQCHEQIRQLGTAGNVLIASKAAVLSHRTITGTSICTEDRVKPPNAGTPPHRSSISFLPRLHMFRFAAGSVAVLGSNKWMVWLAAVCFDRAAFMHHPWTAPGVTEL